MKATDPIKVWRVGHLIVARWDDWQWSYDIPRPGDDSVGAQMYGHAWHGADLPPLSVRRAAATLQSGVVHLESHPAGTKAMIRKLRCIRRGREAARRLSAQEWAAVYGGEQ